MVVPTGSGKTTTPYVILNALNSQEKNSLNIENTTEYHTEGIPPVSVKPEHGLEFAETLRAALHQDLDVILIGEIREEETASASVKASLTGHLALDTSQQPRSGCNSTFAEPRNFSGFISRNTDCYCFTKTGTPSLLSASR